MSRHPTGADMTPHIPENWLVDWCFVANMDDTIPPRNPNDDDDEDEEDEKDESMREAWPPVQNLHLDILNKRLRWPIFREDEHEKSQCRNPRVTSAATPAALLIELHPIQSCAYQAVESATRRSPKGQQQKHFDFCIAAEQEWLSSQLSRC
jgi:hypothetical protein